MSEKEIFSGPAYLKSLLNSSGTDDCFDSYERLTNSFPGLVYIYDSTEKKYWLHQ